jgi:ATP diphosphatase
MRELTDLLEVIATLRDPARGCPWHLEQTPASLAPHTVAETYELVDALEANDVQNTREELADLLFHVGLYCQHAAEKGQFTFTDVARDAAEKLRRRKPHVFPPADDAHLGVADLRTKYFVKGIWERIKAEEKASQGLPARESLLDSVPRSLPALAAAHDIQKRAIKAGFKWPTVDAFYPKIDEELAEVKEAIASGDMNHAEEELGDLLFTVAILGYYTGLSPETALGKANAKFGRRFRYMERKMAERGLPLTDGTFDTMESYWQEAKRLEKAGQLIHVA